MSHFVGYLTNVLSLLESQIRRPLAATDRLEQAHAYRLQRLGRGLRYHLLKHLEPYGITPEQYLILFRLKERDGRGQSELVDPGFDDRANITHLVNQLEKGRLVERRADESDRRKRQVWLTDTGRDLIHSLLDDAVRIRMKLFQDFDDDELEKLIEFVDRIETRLYP
ncbi:MAG: MarR family transcriptional regulator [Myxococcota bacterium]